MVKELSPDKGKSSSMNTREGQDTAQTGEIIEIPFDSKRPIRKHGVQNAISLMDSQKESESGI